MKLFQRLTNLVRGVFGRWLGEREHRNPEAVYEAAIQERVAQYAKLRQAAAGIIYMRQKYDRELAQRSDELARVRRQLEIAVERDDDPAALALLARQEALSTDVARLTNESGELAAEAEAATRNLVTFREEIDRLRDERARTLVRLANAKARLRLHETLSGLSPEADIQALAEVRDHVNRLVTEATLVRDGADPALAKRLGSIRDAEAERAARAQLDELKRARKAASLVPMVLTPQPAAQAAR
jgi:phage shock protein A